MLMESLEYWAKSDLYAGRSTFKLLVEDISKDTSRPVPPTVVPADVQKIYNLLKWRVPQNDCEDLDLVGDGPIGESDTPGPEVPALQEIRKTIQSAYALRSYWRAHRREPFPWLSILTSTIVVRSPANVRLGQLITRYDYDYVRPYGPGQSPQLKQDMVGVAEFMALRRMPPRIPSRTTTTEPQRAEDMDENRPESAGMYSDGASAPTRHYVLRLADSQVNTSFGSKTSDSSAPEQSVPGVSLPLEAMTGGRVASEYGGDEQARTSESPGHSWEVPESTEDSTDPHADNDDVTMEDDTSSHQGNCLSAASLAMLAGEDIEVLPALDQHITPLPGYILNDPLLPVICIADENNLVPLVLAALHQRLVLCYEVPVVGIMYSAATEACQVMIGWPIVGKSELHVAVGDPGVAAERALGVFDLDSIAGSYALARFVYLAADNLCKLDWNERASRHLDDLPLPPWRADAKLSQTYQHDKQGGSRFVERWLHSVSLLGEGRAVGDVGTSQHDTATLEWPYKPNPLIIRSQLSAPLRSRNAGIAEWSMDHHVITIPFHLNGDIAELYARSFEDLIAKLQPVDIVSDPTDGRPSARLQIRDGRVVAHVGTEPGSEVQAATAIRALTAVVHVAIKRGHKGFDPAVPGVNGRAGWQTVSRWWWSGYEREQRDSGKTRFAWRSSALVNYARCTEYDRLVSALGAGDDEISQDTLRHGYDICKATDPPRKNTRAIQWDHIHFVDDAPRPSTSRSRVQDRELFDSLFHVTHVHDFLMGSLSGLSSNDPASIRYRGTRIQNRLRRRLLKYPLRGTYETTTLVIEDFYSDFVEVLGSAVTSELRNLLSFQSPDSPFAPELDASLNATTQIGGPGTTRHPTATSAATDDMALHLPLLLSTYQDHTTGESPVLGRASRNYLRLACVSAAYFLSALGVTDFPVYGLAIYGPFAAVSMAWFSKADSFCYVVDRSTALQCFDLRDEEGIIRYVAFLSKMRDHGEELKLKIQDAKPALIEQSLTAQGREALCWTGHSQMYYYNLLPSDA